MLALVFEVAQNVMSTYKKMTTHALSHYPSANPSYPGSKVRFSALLVNFSVNYLIFIRFPDSISNDEL